MRKSLLSLESEDNYMKIILSPHAEKRLKKLPKIDQIAIAQKIRSLQEEKNDLTAEKLHGYIDIYRVRVGKYRIVYKKSSESCFIILIGHRKDIYAVLQRLLKR